jgi:outer membrane protein assembly factor BamB
MESRAVRIGRFVGQLLAILLIAISATVTSPAQLGRRPDSRRASYPTEPALPGPPPVRFEAVWERELVGRTIVHLSASEAGLFGMSSDGRLSRFDASDGHLLWTVEGFDAARPPNTVGGCLLARKAGAANDSGVDPQTGREQPSGRQDCNPPRGHHPTLIRELRGFALRDAHRGKPRWRVQTGTDIGPSPLLLTTSPAEGAKRRPEHLVIAGTLDGLLIAYRARNGHMAWSTRAASRLNGPIAVWEDQDVTLGDRSRLLVAGAGARKLEVFRGVDGAPAGQLVLEPDSSIILAGPVMLPEAIEGARRCVIAWSPYPSAGCRLLSLRVGSVP